MLLGWWIHNLLFLTSLNKLPTLSELSASTLGLHWPSKYLRTWFNLGIGLLLVAYNCSDDGSYISMVLMGIIPTLFLLNHSPKTVFTHYITTIYWHLFHVRFSRIICLFLPHSGQNNVLYYVYAQGPIKSHAAIVDLQFDGLPYHISTLICWKCTFRRWCITMLLSNKQNTNQSELNQYL